MVVLLNIEQIPYYPSDIEGAAGLSRNVGKLKVSRSHVGMF
jgi:hypothetical protein